MTWNVDQQLLCGLGFNVDSLRLGTIQSSFWCPVGVTSVCKKYYPGLICHISQNCKIIPADPKEPSKNGVVQCTDQER